MCGFSDIRAEQPNQDMESNTTLMRTILLLQCLWLVSVAGFCDETEPRSLYVEGYSGQVSYRAGEEVTLHVSTTAPTYSMEIARLGVGREVVLTTNGLKGGAHPVPENASSHGCGWPASFKFTLPEDWKSGYYHVSLRV